MKQAIDKRQLNQRNNLSGKVGQVMIKDVSGWAGKQGLARFAAGLGIPMPDKDKLDKQHMWRELLERPDEFLRYAVGDVRVLGEVRDRFVGHMRAVQAEALGMPEPDLWTAEDIPMTVGSLVAATFERWLYHSAGGYQDAVRFCVRKL